jgi:hypothetical protein
VVRQSEHELGAEVRQVVEEPLGQGVVEPVVAAAIDQQPPEPLDLGVTEKIGRFRLPRDDAGACSPPVASASTSIGRVVIWNQLPTARSANRTAGAVSDRFSGKAGDHALGPRDPAAACSAAKLSHLQSLTPGPREGKGLVLVRRALCESLVDDALEVDAVLGADPRGLIVLVVEAEGGPAAGSVAFGQDLKHS